MPIKRGQSPEEMPKGEEVDTSYVDFVEGKFDKPTPTTEQAASSVPETSAAQPEFAESPEEKENRLRLQEEANDKALVIVKSISQGAGIWDRPMYSTDQPMIEAAFRPTLDRLKQSGNLLDFLAVKSLGLRHGQMHADFASEAMSENPTTLERVRKEILTTEQNQEVDSRFAMKGEALSLQLTYQADKSGISIEELTSRTDSLGQRDRNALEFRSKSLGEASPEDKAKLGGQFQAKLNAVKTYLRIRESNLKKTEDTRGAAGDEKYHTGMQAEIATELELLKSEGKWAEYLALKGTLEPGIGKSPTDEGYWEKDLVTAALKEGPKVLDSLRSAFTKAQLESLDRMLSWSK